MSIDQNETLSFDKTFGSKPATGSKQDLPKAEFWINIGYTAENIIEGEDAPRFISLPVGIPVDTQEPLKTNQRQEVFAAFNAARNDLHAQIMSVAKNLKPGEERLLNLQIQLRRVNEEVAPATAENNSFVKKLDL